MATTLMAGYEEPFLRCRDYGPYSRINIRNVPDVRKPYFGESLSRSFSNRQQWPVIRIGQQTEPMLASCAARLNGVEAGWEAFELMA